MKPKRSASAVKLSSALGLGLVLAALIVGCSYATYPPRVVRGAAFPIEEAKAVEEGDSAAEVRAVLGEPFEVSTRDSREVWRYYARHRKDGVAYILGFIPNRTPHFIREYELKLTIDDGEVKKVVYTETSLK